MIVFVLVLAPESTKGVLSRYLMEISSGVFIGQTNSKIRDELWDFTIGNMGKGTAIMAYSDNSVQGHQIRTHNLNRRTIQKFDGIELIFIENSNSQNNYSGRTGWSKQSRFIRRKN